MLKLSKNLTEQEDFWKGQFGDDYINRNDGSKLLASKIHYFASIFKNTVKISSCLEFGANIGLNLDAMKTLFPYQKQFGVEINEKASSILENKIGSKNVANCSINNFKITQKWDLVLLKGVLIHINPDDLKSVYKKIYQSSKKFILISEYYNPSPMAISYRGHKNKLFKRDFAGEMMDTYKNLKLNSYGFGYHRDLNFPQDDETWFLLEKE